MGNEFLTGLADVCMVITMVALTVLIVSLAVYLVFAIIKGNIED
jgi:hypothetical protein